MPPRKKPSSYAQAGVDIDEMMSALSAAKRMVKRTATPGVLSDIGSFGGLFASPGKNQVLVASTDGVGTKLKVAVMAGRHDTVGQDLVNHCTNDILVQGAVPLFFLDYVGAARLEGPVFKDVVRGLCKACRANGCALLGGETAEMPGLYPTGEYDLVGTIVGVADRRRLVTGEDIREGDVAIALPSSGLHTNGYSLARKVIFDTMKLKVSDPLPGTGRTVAEALLAVHKSYLSPIRKLMADVKVRGMAHITGGGLLDNIPRILPADVDLAIDRRTWKVPPLFRLIREHGRVDTEEMYRVFNMGVGYVAIVRKRDASKALSILKAARGRPIAIGSVRPGKRRVVWAD
jgi:phosphoribosylformylglycinamidine cyclo-ligase